MNLQNIISELIKLRNSLNLQATLTGTAYQISDWMRVSNTLNRLSDFGFLRDEVMEIFKVDDIVNIRMDQWIAREGIYKELALKIEGLKGSINACLRLITEYINVNIDIPEGSGLINTRMPDNLDMVKMSSICNDLDKAFNQCPLITDEIKFVGVEKGSVFFVFVTTITSISILGKVLNVALDVQKKHYQNQMMRNKLETMGNVTESIGPIIKLLDTEVKDYCKAKAVEIEESKNLNPEDLERLALTIKTLSVLIGQGVQMQCILDGTNENIDINFPKPEEFQSLIDGIKMLN